MLLRKVKKGEFTWALGQDPRVSLFVAIAKNLTQNRQREKKGEGLGCCIFQRGKQSTKAEQHKTNNPANSYYKVLAQNSYCTNGTPCRGNNEMLSPKMMLSIVVTHHTASCLASPVLPSCWTRIQLRVTASLAGEI